jgi:SAM-dependent methyltransferase
VADNLKVLNLGSGPKVSSSPDVVNIDHSIYFRFKTNPALGLFGPLFMRGERLKHLTHLPDNILFHDLRKGIPFDSNSINVVYHSHLLEHLDRSAAKKLLLEAKRVLKPNGIHRIVIPDFEKLCRDYLFHVAACEKDPRQRASHEEFIGAIIEQAVRIEAHGTSQQRPLRRYFENLLLGDARKRSETHQWMYDRISLSELLVRMGYRNPRTYGYNRSGIPNWSQYRLDTDESGNEHKAGSLYMEAQK